MKIEVIGSGSAYSVVSNTSAILISDDYPHHWLVDCGPTVPRALWQRNTDVNQIDVIYFTHIHPDHCSGLAALLNQWKSFSRKKPLTIYCQAEQRGPLEALVLLATWPEQKIEFSINWVTIEDHFTWQGWRINTAYTQHEVPNRALRVEVGSKVVFYSGDGRATESTRQLMQGADLAFQECASFFPLASDSSHGDLDDCLQLLISTQVKQLGLYHCFDEMIPAIEQKVTMVDNLFLSKDGLVFYL
jgi:ribonuclease BN (tRNA processing enzyme)